MNIGSPPGFLWWDENWSFYTGRYHGWKCCSVCGPSELGPETTTLVMDHCHQTGLYRGLLCSNCNLGEGRSKDSWWLLWRIAAPSLAVGRRRVYAQEPNTSLFSDDELLGSPMTLLLRRANTLNLKSGRLTQIAYI